MLSLGLLSQYYRVFFLFLSLYIYKFISPIFIFFLMTSLSQRALELSYIRQKSLSNYYSNEISHDSKDELDSRDTDIFSPVSFTNCASTLSNPLFKLNFLFSSPETPSTLDECREEIIGNSLSQQLIIPPINKQTSQVIQINSNSLNFSINCMELNQEGELLAIGTENGELKIYNNQEIIDFTRKM